MITHIALLKHDFIDYLNIPPAVGSTIAIRQTQQYLTIQSNHFGGTCARNYNYFFNRSAAELTFQNELKLCSSYRRYVRVSGEAQ